MKLIQDVNILETVDCDTHVYQKDRQYLALVTQAVIGQECINNS